MNSLDNKDDKKVICDNCHASPKETDEECWNCGSKTFVYEVNLSYAGQTSNPTLDKPKCPRCGSKGYIVSIFGSVCANCLYAPSKDGEIEHTDTNVGESDEL